MERRRRAFGLKNVGNKKEIQVPSVPSTSGSVGSPNSSLRYAKTVSGARPSRQSTVPEQCTPKRKIGNQSSESPRSPIVSPSFQPVFPRTLSSPEIEVSWDWGCSQTTNDMLPPLKRPKRKCQLQISPLVEPASTFSRLTQSQEVSTKENEERLAFYKNILSKSFQKKSEMTAVVDNNNVQKSTISTNPETSTTPRRSRRSLVELTKNEEPINDPFDDSANEFMFEFSQAIEEKLMNGEIEAGSVVEIDLREKAPQSQQSGRKVCQEKTKQNIFPSENGINVQKRLQVNSVKSPKNRINQMNSDVDGEDSPESKSGGSNKSYYLTNDLHTVLTPKKRQNENGSPSKSQPVRTLSQEKTKQNLFPGESGVQGNSVESSQNQINKINSDISNLTPGSPNKTYYITNDLNTVLTPKKRRSKDLPQVNVSQVKRNFKTDTTSSVKTASGSFNTSNAVSSAKVADKSCSRNNSFLTSAQQKPTQTFPRECDRPSTVPNSRSINSSKCDSVDKFRRQQSGSSMCQTKPMLNEKRVQPQVTNSSSRQVQERLGNMRINGTRITSGTKGEGSPSLRSLLDDDFDMELSSLDFDSLVEPATQPTFKRPPEMTLSQKCSKQEIEAKRLAALNRLMMKRKR